VDPDSGEAAPQLGHRLGGPLQGHAALVLDQAAAHLRLDPTGLERALAERQAQWTAQQLGVGELLPRVGRAVVEEDVQAVSSENCSTAAAAMRAGPMP
jgi:hypothetical protein